MIKLRINGREVELDGPTPLGDYLASLGVDQRAVAVELNGRILERAEMAGTTLAEGDVVEIVRMVGGGLPQAFAILRLGKSMPRNEKAAKEAVDSRRLLPGEDPAATHPEDALHWAQVYRELIEFKNRAIDRIVIDAIGLGDVARHEVETTDLVVLRAERDRLVRRSEFWRDRYRVLAKPGS
jgi:sulfur carrier protein